MMPCHKMVMFFFIDHFPIAKIGAVVKNIIKFFNEHLN